MARQPFFTGNYGSALAQVDTRPIMEGARAQAEMYQNLGQSLGQNIGGAIEKYGLNKVKRAKLTGDIEAYLKENPDYINESTMTGDEAVDKKNMTENEKFVAGDLSMAGLEGLAGKLARGDTLRKNRLLEESQMMQNKMQELTFGIDKELRETRIGVETDKARLIRLNRLMEEEADPQKREVFRLQREELIADFGMGESRRELERKRQGLTGKQIDAKESIIPLETAATTAKLKEVPGQVEDATATRKRNKKIADALFKASGDAVGMAKTSMEDRDLKRNQVETYILSGLSNIKVNELNALAKFASPTVNQQATVLAADQGRLLGLTLTDPITKGQITFKKYLELNNTKGDDQYPLTGDAAGTAGTYHGRYVTGQRQLQELYDGVQVQANNTSGGAGADGGAGGGTGGVLPSAIDSKMTPVQADAAKTARIAEIRTLIDNLNTEFDDLETPNAMMPATVPISATWRGYGGAPTTHSAPQPATLGYLERKKKEIPAEIAALRAELTQLANTNF